MSISHERTLQSKPAQRPPGSEAFKQRRVPIYRAPFVERPIYRARRPRLRVLIALVLLVGIIVSGSMWGSRLIAGGIWGQAPQGPFVQPPLTPAQVNAMHHLENYMQYKQLASLYVSRMSLDEELGQLIMVEYAEDFYSPQLDMMINQF